MLPYIAAPWILWHSESPNHRNPVMPSCLPSRSRHSNSALGPSGPWRPQSLLCSMQWTSNIEHLLYHWWMWHYCVLMKNGFEMFRVFWILVVWISGDHQNDQLVIYVTLLNVTLLHFGYLLITNLAENGWIQSRGKPWRLQPECSRRSQRPWPWEAWRLDALLRPHNVQENYRWYWHDNYR